jgi:hypothetical protein
LPSQSGSEYLSQDTTGKLGTKLTSFFDKIFSNCDTSMLLSSKIHVFSSTQEDERIKESLVLCSEHQVKQRTNIKNII